MKPNQYVPPQDGLEVACNGTLELFDAAYNSDTFAGRHKFTVDAITQEAFAQTGSAPVAVELGRAAEEASMQFSWAFDASGQRYTASGYSTSVVEAATAKYKKAKNDAGRIAVRHLPNVLEAASLEVDYDSVRKLLDTADFHDAVDITASLLQRIGGGHDDALRNAAANVQQEDDATIRASLQRIIDPSDRFYADIEEELPVLEERPLSPYEKKVLTLACRTANATWKASQAHLAVYDAPRQDGRPDTYRINGDKPEIKPFDLLLSGMFTEQIELGRSPEDALKYVSFTVWKDVAQVREYAGELPRLRGGAYRVARKFGRFLTGLSLKGF